MLKKILIALDGSAHAESVLPWALRWAQPDQTRVVLARIVEPGTLGTRLTRASVRPALTGASHYVRRAAEKLRGRGYRVKAEVISSSNVAAGLAKLGREEQCDLIALATRGGGISAQLIRRADRPVLVVRPPLVLPDQSGVGSILVPLDGSPLAESAIPFVDRVARFFEANVVFLHVTPADRKGSDPQVVLRAHRLKERMKAVIERMAERGIAAEYREAKGDPAVRILGHSLEHELIATTTNGWSGPKRWLLGSVAERVIREARVPVLVFKGPKRFERGRRKLLVIREA